MTAKRFFKLLPEEIVEHIIVRVRSTKTILRCTCVCKSWYSFIKSSEFINTHLSRRNNIKYLLCKTKRSTGEAYNYSLYSNREVSKKSCTLVLPNRLTHIEIHGWCDGVICYTEPGNQEDIYLLNPAVRKLKTLPKIGKTVGLRTAIGFWFNTEKRDYEVVKIDYDKDTCSVYVYGLRCNCWKIISDACPGTLKIIESSLVYASGTMYWLAKQMNGWTFVTLNVNNGKFQEESFSRWVSPQNFLLIGASSFYLTGVDANSRLVIIGNGRERIQPNRPYWQGSSFIFDVFEKSITFHRLVYPAGFSNNGNALFWKKLMQPEMVSFDFSTKQFTDFVFDDYNVETARPFVKTLVLLNDSDVQRDRLVLYL